MTNKIVFAGFGGQGVLMAGYTFAYSIMRRDLYVTFMPSYGAEQRGGTANCTVSVSDEEIASPIASAPDCAVIMNGPSLTRFSNQVRDGGTFIINSTLSDGKVGRKNMNVYLLPATQMATDLGNMRITNMVMLGAFLTQVRDLLTLEEVIENLKEILPAHRQKLIEVNSKGIKLGYDHVMNDIKV